METRAPYALIGLFVLTAIAAVFGFIYWLHNTGGLSERAIYRVRFESSVAGVLIGSAVMFNGIRVGEVTDLQIGPENPHQVTATIAISPSAPVREDTKAGLDIQGLTGIAVVALTGGNPDAPPLAKNGGEPPVLIADPLAWQSITYAARTALQRLDSILTDNSEPLRNAIANISTFSDALARNSKRIDGIAAGLERMTGGAAETAPRMVYDLTAPRNFPAPGKRLDKQLVVSDPSAVLMFETRKIIVYPGESDDPSFTGSQWSDNIPKLIQSKIIQSFDNAKYFAAVGRSTDDLTADYKLLIDIRSFQVSISPQTAADAEFAAKIVGDNGRIIGTRIFHATVPTKETTAPAAVAALDEAFGKIATELVVWTAGVI